MNINVNEIMNYVTLCSDRIWLDGLCGVSYCAGNKDLPWFKITNQCSCFITSFIVCTLTMVAFANILKL